MRAITRIIRSGQADACRCYCVIRIEIVDVTWTIFTETKSKKKAERILKRFISLLGIEGGEIEIEKRDDIGCSCYFSHDLESENWPYTVIECIVLAQKVGHSWSILSDINEEIDIWSEKIKLTGVDSIHGMCVKNV